MSWEPPFSTGTDGAEPTGLRRLLRLPGRGNLLLVGGAVVGAGILLLPAAPKDGPLPPVPVAASPAPSSVSAYSSPTADEAGRILGTPVAAASSHDKALGAADGGRSLYSIYLYKLPGLAPDAAAGTLVDVWVTWRTSVAKKPSVDLLVDNAVLQRIESGFEEGAVADLMVTEEDVVNLIYGERYGSLNASISSP